jgi:hypothetical protein
MNALMAIAMAKLFGTPTDAIAKALHHLRESKDFRIRLKRMFRCILMIMHIIQQKLMQCIKQFESCIQIKVLAIFSLICLVEREILLMILPKVYRPLMKSFYWIFILRIAYGRNKLTMVDG